jgi:hypothetical protein
MSTQSVDPSLELSLVDDVAFRLQRQVGLRAVLFGKSTLLGIAIPTLIPIVGLLSTQGPIKEVLKKIVGAFL